MELTDKQRLEFGIHILTAIKATEYDCDLEKGENALLSETEIKHMSKPIQKEFENMSPKLKNMFLSYCKSERLRLNGRAVYVANHTLEKLAEFNDINNPPIPANHE